MENFVISQHISFMLSFILVTTQKGKKSDILGQRSQKENGWFQSLQFGVCENSKRSLEILLHYIARLFLAATVVNNLVKEPGTWG